MILSLVQTSLDATIKTLCQSSSSRCLVLRAPDPNLRFLKVTFVLSLPLARLWTLFSLNLPPSCFSFFSLGGPGRGMSSMGRGSEGSSGRSRLGGSLKEHKVLIPCNETSFVYSLSPPTELS